MAPAKTPFVSFYKLIPDVPNPQRADKSVGGTLPTRAYRYCEAIRIASSLGWYIFPAIDISLVWDGTDIIWKFPKGDSWQNLESIQYPGFLSQFNYNAPEDLVDCVPPLLAVGAEPGIVQVWTGIFAKTQPDWSLLVRPPANLAKSNKYEHFEGVIETDRWFGPLFTNLRLKKTDVPIDILQTKPLMQVQPIHRSTYQNSLMDDYNVVSSISEFNDEDWARYRQTIVTPGKSYEREKGYYARLTRKKTTE